MRIDFVVRGFFDTLVMEKQIFLIFHVSPLVIFYHYIIFFFNVEKFNSKSNSNYKSVSKTKQQKEVDCIPLTSLDIYDNWDRISGKHQNRDFRIISWFLWFWKIPMDPIVFHSRNGYRQIPSDNICALFDFHLTSDTLSRQTYLTSVGRCYE